MTTNLGPEIPDFSKQSSVDRLLSIETYPQRSELDVAVAQDVFNKRLSVSSLQRNLREIPDYSINGGSVSSWIYRLGGFDAIEDSMKVLPEADVAKERFVEIYTNMHPGKDWIRNLAATEHNAEILLMILGAAIERGEDESVEIIAQKVPEIEKRILPHSIEESSFGWLVNKIGNYRMRKAIEDPSAVVLEEIPDVVLPFSQDVRLAKVDARAVRGEINNIEAEKLRKDILNQRSNDLRAIVIAAVKSNDISILNHYMAESGSTGDIFGDVLRFTIGELGIIQMGLELLEDGLNLPKKKSVFEITNIEEAEQEFEKSVAQYSVQDGNLSNGMQYQMNIAAIADRSYWLVMRLGELKDITMLKRILDHQYARPEVKKEAVRQLLIAGETQFLRGYALINEEPVNFWDTKVRVDRSSMNPTLEENSRMLRRIEEDTPAYVEAIIGRK